MFATASILMRIRHLGDGLPPTARRIATYIAEHAEEVIRMSITEVAEQTGASEGSIVGLCRRLGTSGFQELKILLSRDLVEPMRMIHEDLRPSDTVTDVAEHVFAAHIASLQETQKAAGAEDAGASGRDRAGLASGSRSTASAAPRRSRRTSATGCCSSATTPSR